MLVKYFISYLPIQNLLNLVYTLHLQYISIQAGHIQVLSSQAGVAATNWNCTNLELCYYLQIFSFTFIAKTKSFHA